VANRAAAGGVRDSRMGTTRIALAHASERLEIRLGHSKHRGDSALNPGRFCPPVVADFRDLLLKKDYWRGN